MTEFDDLFAQVGSPVLKEQFGEPLVYLPEHKRPRRITAIHVDRNPLEETPGMAAQETVGTRLVIQVDNNPITGISSAEIDTGRDEIEVATRKGAVNGVFGPRRRRITKLLSDTNGITKFEVR